MKNSFNSLLFVLAVVLFVSCSKEQQQADELKGKWRIENFLMKEKSLVNDTLANNYFEFFDCDKAYTASCYGVFTSESTDTSKFKTVVDTFRYNINAGNFSITKVKKARFLLMRYNIKNLENGKLEMGNDTLTVKAQKI